MFTVERHLHLVPAGPTESDPISTEHEDVGLAVMFFAVAALPVACAIAGVGNWGDGSLGLGTLGILVSGRQLCAWLVGRCHRTPPSHSPERVA